MTDETPLVFCRYYMKFDEETLQYALTKSWHREGKTIIVTDPKLMRDIDKNPAIINRIRKEEESNMTIVRSDEHCPKCGRVTHQSFELNRDYENMPFSLESITQRCGNCELERTSNKITWGPWQTTYTDYVEWEDPDKKEETEKPHAHATEDHTDIQIKKGDMAYGCGCWQRENKIIYKGIFCDYQSHVAGEVLQP